MKEEEEKKTADWEIRDPKPPVIRNSRTMVCGYPTYPDHARFDTDAVNSRFVE